MKGKEEKEGLTHVNSAFLRITRRDKKTLNGQCQKNGRKKYMGKSGNLFKKIRNIKGTFDPRMGTIMDRDGKEITETEEINKRW